MSRPTHVTYSALTSATVTTPWIPIDKFASSSRIAVLTTHGSATAAECGFVVQRSYSLEVGASAAVMEVDATASGTTTTITVAYPFSGLRFLLFSPADRGTTTFDVWIYHPGLGR